MKILPLLVLIVCTCARAEEPDKSKDLISTVHQLSVIAHEAAPLAKQEFSVLDARFKGDQYNDLIARLRTPVEMANATTNFEEHVPEALAGSAHQAELLNLYMIEEAGLFHLNVAFQYWVNAPRK